MLRIFLNDIKIEHSLFAMPFLYSGAILALKDGAILTLRDFLLITFGLFFARTAAMTINRILDRDIDALNPRTADRPLAKGIINVRVYVVIATTCLFALFVIAYMLNYLCVLLYPIVVAVFILYPLTKRFTWLSHIILGLALSFAPVGAYVALKASIDIGVMILGLAVIFWVAGFDIIYAIQDYEFDRKCNLKSIPARFGIDCARKISAIFHVFTIAFLIIFYFIEKMGLVYALGLFILACILAYEHKIRDIETAFFKLNAIFSFFFFIFLFVDYVML